MSLERMRKDILELKQIAALEKKQSEDNLGENMTDEELRQAIEDECKGFGFESFENMIEYGHNYLKKQGIMFNEYNLCDIVMDHLLDIVKQNRGY